MSEKFKICMIVANSVHWDPRVRKEATICAQSGFDVVVVGVIEPKFDQSIIDSLPFHVSLLDNPFRPARFALPGLIGKVVRNILYRIYYSLGLIVLCYKENAQIYHANDYNTLISGWVAARLRRAKIVYDTHEICTENHGIANKKVLKSIVKFFESFFIRRVDRVVCVSHAAADYISQLYKIQTPDVITNCAWLAGNAAIDDNHPTDNNHFEVLNHGQFYDGRGYDLLIQSVAFLKTYQGKIKIVMRGFGSCETKYRDLVKTENANGLVQFVPPVRVDQLVSAASSSHIGVAITEGICMNFKCSISNKIFEYLAAGLPVIMSDIPEHRYYNERYHFGIILENLLPETIANAIINIYKDKDLYDQLKSNVLLARKVLCWEVEGEKWILLYRNLLKQQ